MHGGFIMCHKYSIQNLLSFLIVVFQMFLMSSKIMAMAIPDQSAMPEFIYEDILDRSLRLKITNQCPFTCKFCHNEGTELPGRSDGRASILLDSSIARFKPVEAVCVPEIEDLGDASLSASFIAQLNTYKMLGYNQMHLTGGEPSCHPHLSKLIKILKQNGFTVKMTSNGQFNPKLLKTFVDSGLDGITFSILSLDPLEFLGTQLRTYKTESIALSVAKRAIERTMSNIIYAKKLGLNVKINAIILGTQDKRRVDCIADFAAINGITLSLLPCVLSSGATADEKRTMERLAFQYALERGARYVKTVRSRNSSSGSHRFILPDADLSIVVKYIQDCQPKILCEGCEHFGKISCTENFYGLRVEYRDKVPFVRLCVQKSTPTTLMPLDSFVHSAMIVLAPGSFAR